MHLPIAVSYRGWRHPLAHPPKISPSTCALFDVRAVHQLPFEEVYGFDSSCVCFPSTADFHTSKSSTPRPLPARMDAAPLKPSTMLSTPVTKFSRRGSSMRAPGVGLAFVSTGLQSQTSTLSLSTQPMAPTRQRCSSSGRC